MLTSLLYYQEGPTENHVRPIWWAPPGGERSSFRRSAPPRRGRRPSPPFAIFRPQSPDYHSNHGPTKILSEAANSSPGSALRPERVVLVRPLRRPAVPSEPPRPNPARRRFIHGRGMGRRSRGWGDEPAGEAGLGHADAEERGRSGTRGEVSSLLQVTRFTDKFARRLMRRLCLRGRQRGARFPPRHPRLVERQLAHHSSSYPRPHLPAPRAENLAHQCQPKVIQGSSRRPRRNGRTR